MFGAPDAVMAVFVLAALPLVRQDHAELSVGWWSLAAFTVLVQAAAIWLTPEGLLDRMVEMTAVIAGGTLLLAFRGGMGEGDVLFAANLPAVFWGFSLMSALAWGCIAGIAGWGIGALRRPEAAEEPMPLIPALVVGACMEYALDRMVAW